MPACLLLDTFEQYLEMSFIFGLLICMACAKNCSVRNGILLLEFFLQGGGFLIRLVCKLLQRT
jgi:hypothetical protein